MLSPAVEWVDIDADQWANFWTRCYGQRPHWIIGIEDQGTPLAIVDSEHGQLPLERWPALEAAERGVIVERAALEQLWHDQQTMFDPADDFDVYAIAVSESSRAFVRSHMVSGTYDDAPIQYKALQGLLEAYVAPQGSFLVTIYDRDALWWSLAGRIRNGKIDLLTSSQGLLAPGREPTGTTWQDTFDELVGACEHRFAGPFLGIALQLERFDIFIRAASPLDVLRAAIEEGHGLMTTTEWSS